MPEIYDNVVKSFAYISLIIELSKGRKLTGYDILVHVKGFGLEVSPGTVYHHLDMLEEAGIIKSESAIRRKATKIVYEMTDEGMKRFKKFKEKWREPVLYAYQNIVELP